MRAANIAVPVGKSMAEIHMLDKEIVREFLLWKIWGYPAPLLQDIKNWYIVKVSISILIFLSYFIIIFFRL